MEQSTSSEANGHSASQQIPLLLRNPKVRYRVYKNLPLVPSLIQMNPAHTFTPHFTKIHFNIIFPSTPKSSAWSLPFRFSDQNFVCIFRPSHAR
jgi:hypothetical protein